MKGRVRRARGRARILLANDDGIDAPGLAALAEALAPLGELRVSAPRAERSGVGHAVSLHDPISAERRELAGCGQALCVEGTPADAVKLALTTLWPGWAGLVVSGINPGPNVGLNVFYSGTVAAAAEGAIYGVPAFAISRDVSGYGSFEVPARVARRLAERVLARGLPAGCFLNVNAPAREPAGWRLARHGLSGFRESYTRQDGGYMIDGVMHVRPEETDSDAAALAAGFVSVTPMALDLTAGVSDASAAPAAPAALAEAWGWLLEAPRA